MIRGVEAVVLEAASPCSMFGNIVLGAGGYLTGKLEMPADCCGSRSKMHGQAKFPALVAVLTWIGALMSYFLGR